MRCPAGSGSYTTVGNRQELTATPYALYATAAGSAPWSGLTGVPAGFADGADNDVVGGLSCAGGQVAKWSGTAWTCAADNDTTYSAGTGLILTGTVFTPDTTYLQRRVSGTCAAGSSIRAVNDDGTVTCQTTAAGWSLTGNAGTTPGTNYLGTSDNQALELKVNGRRALRLEPNATSPNLIGGHSSNGVQRVPWRHDRWWGTGGIHLWSWKRSVLEPGHWGLWNSRRWIWQRCRPSMPPSVEDTTIPPAEAGRSSVVAPITPPRTIGATVGGGGHNTAAGPEATVGGGYQNTAVGIEATVGGGGLNTAEGEVATVGGGNLNTASGIGGTVPGGMGNTALGAFSFAAGRRAKANHQGSFVWGDSTDADFASNAQDEFAARAGGGVRLVVGTGAWRLSQTPPAQTRWAATART